MNEELDILFPKIDVTEPINQFSPKLFIVIGEPKELGAVIVEELIKNGVNVIGISRTSFVEIPDYYGLFHSKNYSHIELDITSLRSERALEVLCKQLPEEPVCIIFNASSDISDIKENGKIDFIAFSEINRVTINGLSTTLKAFENHLLTYGGTFVGVSSFNAINPPFDNLKAVYPATKAYMDMFLRTLRMAWDKKVNVVTVHAGKMKRYKSSKFFDFIVPTYSQVAKKIVQGLMSKTPPKEINYPLINNFIHRHIYKLMPDIVYYHIYKLHLKIFKMIEAHKSSKN